MRKKWAVVFLTLTLTGSFWGRCQPIDFNFSGKIKIDPSPQLPRGVIVASAFSFPTDYIEPLYSQINRQADVTYDSTRNLGFDVYTPVGAQGDRCAVIFAHGGSLTAGDKFPEGEYILRGDKTVQDVGPVNRGYVGFSVNYRLTGDYAGAVADFTNAVNFIRSQAAAYHLNTDCLHYAGFSAGGSIIMGYGLGQKQAMGKNDGLWVLNGQLTGAYYAEVPTVSFTNANDPVVPPTYLINLKNYLDGKGIYNSLFIAPEVAHGPFSSFREVRVAQTDFANHIFIAGDQESRTGLKVERRPVSNTNFDEIFVGITSVSGAKFDLIASKEINTNGKITPDGVLYLGENNLETVFSNGSIPDGTGSLAGTGLGTVFVKIGPIDRATPTYGFQAKLRGRGAKNIMTNLGKM